MRLNEIFAGTVIMNRFFLRAALCAVIGVPSAIDAQGCCGIGGSLVAGGIPTLENGNVFVQAGAEHSSATYQSRYRTSIPLTLGYGVTNRLAVFVKTSYAWMHEAVFTQSIVVNNVVLLPDTTIVFDNNDIGDATVAAQFSIVPLNVIDKQELKAGMDVGIPWGPDQKRLNRALLSAAMQSGSGGLTLGGFVSYTKAVPAYKCAASATIGGRYKFKNRRGEKPGAEGSALVSMIAGPFWITTATLSVGYKATNFTYEANGVKVPSSAGSRLDILPGMEFAFTEQVKASCEATVPLWRDEYQKTYGKALGLRASLFFLFPVFGDG